MNCKKCNSSNVTIQAVNKVSIKNKHHGLIYWLLIGWWLRPMLWLFLTIPYLIFRIFKPRNKKVINKIVNIAVCQDCGCSWRIK